MKRIFLFMISLALVVIMAGCGEPQEEQPEEQIDYEIAMVTDSGMIMDGGYSQTAWTAISDFGSKEGVSHKYYKAAEASEEAYKAAIDNAVDKGAKVIIADGDSFEDVVYKAQKEYKDVSFILIDAEPVDQKSGETKIGNNTHVVIFASEQAGYLAGYSAVKDGNTKLGFMGDSSNSVIMDYGYGFLQGAEAAAKDSETDVKVKYHYCTDEEDRDAILDRAGSWYEGGTEVIFACGNDTEQPVVEAAELAEKRVIAFETDKHQMSDTIMTSAAKNIAKALESALEQYYDGEFPGGNITQYNAENDGIFIDMENARFDSFDKGDYKEVFGSLADGKTAVKTHESGDIRSLKLSKVNVKEE